MAKVIDRLLGPAATLKTNLPSTARVSLNYQAAERRHILHLLYANTISRGGSMNLSGGTVSASGLTIQVIEDLLPLHDISITLANLPRISRVTLEPQGQEAEFIQKEGAIYLQLDGFTCHQMIVLQES